MINKVTLIGILGADPEIRTIESGATVTKVNIATNENYKDKDGNWHTETEWHTVVAWRDLANRLQNQAKKGSLIYVEGKLTTRSWTDQSGQQRKTTEVLASVVRILEKREGSGAYHAAQAAVTESNTPPPIAPPTEGDDLPF